MTEIKEIASIIENGLRQGKTTEQIADEVITVVLERRGLN